MCSLCNMLLFQSNSLCFTSSWHFAKYEEYSITQKYSKNHFSMKTYVTTLEMLVIPKPQRTGVHKFYSVLEETLDISHFRDAGIFKACEKLYVKSQLADRFYLH